MFGRFVLTVFDEVALVCPLVGQPRQGDEEYRLPLTNHLSPVTLAIMVKDTIEHGQYEER
jgi:hypothetical protein